LLPRKGKKAGDFTLGEERLQRKGLPRLEKAQTAKTSKARVAELAAKNNQEIVEKDRIVLVFKKGGREKEKKKNATRGDEESKKKSSKDNCPDEKGHSTFRQRKRVEAGFLKLRGPGSLRGGAATKKGGGPVGSGPFFRKKSAEGKRLK